MMASRKPGPTWHGHVSQEVKGRYERNTYDKLLLRVRRDGGDGVTAAQIRDAAAAAGQSVNAWIIEVIRRELYGG